MAAPIAPQAIPYLAFDRQERGPFSPRISGKTWSFGTLKAAQARGDLEALSGRGLRALRVHLKGDPAAALRSLKGLVEDAVNLATRDDG